MGHHIAPPDIAVDDGTIIPPVITIVAIIISSLIHACRLLSDRTRKQAGQTVKHAFPTGKQARQTNIAITKQATPTAGKKYPRSRLQTDGCSRIWQFTFSSFGCSSSPFKSFKSPIVTTIPINDCSLSPSINSQFQTQAFVDLPPRSTANTEAKATIDLPLRSTATTTEATDDLTSPSLLVVAIAGPPRRPTTVAIAGPPR
jgi:hypothetical protein